MKYNPGAKQIAATIWSYKWCRLHNFQVKSSTNLTVVL